MTGAYLLLYISTVLVVVVGMAVLSIEARQSPDRLVCTAACLQNQCAVHECGCIRLYIIHHHSSIASPSAAFISLTRF